MRIQEVMPPGKGARAARPRVAAAYPFLSNWIARTGCQAVRAPAALLLRVGPGSGSFAFFFHVADRQERADWPGESSRSGWGAGSPDAHAGPFRGGRAAGGRRVARWPGGGVADGNRLRAGCECAR